MEIKVIDKSSKEVDKVKLTIQATEDKNNSHNLYLVDKYQKAYVRQGTLSTKTRSEVRGGGAKPYKQKGTGRARRGTQRSPLIVGGGVIFGPKPRSFKIRLNKKQFKSVFNHIFQKKEEQLKVLRVNLEDTYKTKEIVSLLDTTNLNKILLIVNSQEINLEVAARNISNLEVCTSSFVPVETFLKSDSVVITETALKEIEEKQLS